MGDPMTEERLALTELLEKAGDGDFLRTVAEAVLQLLMDADVEGLIGAGRYERNGERTTWRNGHRDRVLDTRLGSLQLRIPKLRQGRSYEEANSGQRSARLFSPQITSGDRHVHTSLFSSAVRCSRRPRRYLRLDGAKSVEMVDHLTVAGKR
jgi:transposase-like protein